MINIYIDNVKVEVPAGTTILEAAKKINIDIPHLCYLEGLPPYGACRVCVVEVEKEATLVAACKREVREGMKIFTQSPRVRKARRLIVELLIADHIEYCPTCARNQNCELLKLANYLGIKEVRFIGEKHSYEIDKSSPSLERDANKCVLCGRCVRVCKDVQTVEAIGIVNRGTQTKIATFMDKGLGEVSCTNCGQCINVCPVGALKEKSAIDAVWDAIFDAQKHVVVQEAPAVRVSLGEEFGLSKGELVKGKMYAALRKLGVDAVFDTNFTADLTIVEEATELVERIKNKSTLPMITSCSPGWIKFMEHFYPDLMNNLSTCKSPQQMFGALAKTYYAENAGIKPENIVSVSIMPCTAKKFESQREEMKSSGFRDVDYVLTTREFAQMIKEAGIDFVNLKEEKADDLMGVYSGAGTIFGATGGVMEAALRTAYKLITGKELENLDILPVRGMDGIKSATVDIDGLKIKVAVAHGLGNARKLLDEIRRGESEYHFIEIMACPGGCVGGGGQPINLDMTTRSIRGEGLYDEDKNLDLRRSHENPEIKKLYENYLKKPLGEKSHHLLHTHYIKREKI